MHTAPQNLEIERIYAHASAHGLRAIAITACNAGEGVSHVTLALAQRYLLAGASALVVDLNLHRPLLTSLLETYDAQPGIEPFTAPRLTGPRDGTIALTGVTVPAGRNALLKLRTPGVLEHCIRHWQQQFDVVLFDTSPLNRINANNLPAERVAAACDGALLVTLSGQTTRAQVSEGVGRLQAAGARLSGCIINDRFNPPLKSELLREIERLRSRLPRLADRLGRFVRTNRLLSLDS